ncbi:Replication protein [Micromonospora sp. MW-13]|uniref:protein rep n=1 Tax=Micromonospora sp. MW-13 TaxID=2094022 RepID=UPI000E44FEF9|nr:protein rep [Micromonospora sp. MW-13]RGC64992.1 Replication protein [Micromonospora sp. MW-13]
MSALPRVAKCGMPIGNTPVRVKRDSDGGAHMSGHETCSSVWSCPVCAASIRSHRADEITRGLAEHLRRPTRDERRSGRKKSGLPAQKGGAVLVTLTLPHQAADALARTVELVSEAFRFVQRGRAYAGERDRYGILGHIRAFEVTHGEHGWHPHLHLILVTAARLTDEECRELEAAWLARWNRFLAREGWPAASAAHGVRFDLVRRDSAAVAVYVTKLQEGADKGKPARRSNVGNEVTRSDLKGGRRGSRVPFEILADFGSDGSAEDLALWHEYQLATKGRSAIRWSRGLRALLLPDEDELTDEAITDEAADAETIAVITAPLYRAIAARPYGEAYLHVAAERGGLDGIRRYVRALGLSPSGVHPPEAWENFAEIDEYNQGREE